MEVKDLVQKIAKDFDENREKYEPYIRYVRFPKYKNIKSGSKLDTPFPMTVLVGENGSNKSSIIRAFYGAPANKSLGDYWFETKIDTIKEDKESPSCFIYGYINSLAGKEVEVLKTRVKKEQNPDYWEPSRPIAKYGMERLPEKNNLTEEEKKYRSQTRWNPIKKEVVYLDFRHEALSAYDKLFYCTDLVKASKRFKTKQDYLRRYSKYIRKVVDEDLSDYNLYNKKIIDNRLLEKNSVKIISGILDKQYESIRIIQHTFYTSESAKTILLSSKNGTSYSEAFAGSGEFSVVCLVDSIIQAQEGSLILLDEPEVSLHPSAQKKLLIFLLQQILSKKLQIIVATHSPCFVKSLPVGAVKLLKTDEHGDTCIENNVYTPEVFQKIGTDLLPLTILVEDDCSKYVLEACIRNLDKKNLFNICSETRFGDDGIFKYDAVTNFIENNMFVVYCIDGDKKPKNNKSREDYFYDIASQVSLTQSNTNEHLKNKNIKNFAKYLERTVFFFPGERDPEEILWHVIPDDEKKGIKVSSEDYKDAIRQACKKMYHDDSADRIREFERNKATRLLNICTSPFDDDLKDLVSRLVQFASNPK